MHEGSHAGQAAQSADGATRHLARLSCNIKFQALPSNVIERTKDLLLDHLGVSLFGAGQPSSAVVRDLMIAETGRPESTIYGSGRVPARAAALANGAAAHAIEFDDTHDESLQHPGCVVIPAAMAIAEALGASGRELITAIVVGYEVQCRIGLALGPSLTQRGFHPTATCGVYGAAAAAGRLLGLDVDGIVSAFGLAASMSSGLMQFSQDPAHAAIKRLYSGLPAERGLLAAMMAAKGLHGPHQGIEGRFGFANVLGANSDLARITSNIGGGFQLERITIKLYPCCKQFHSLIEAIAECRAKRPFDPSEVTEVEPLCTRAMIDTHMEYRPRSTMAAQYSLPYTTAAAILLDPANAASFNEPAISRTDVLQLADRVNPTLDAALDGMFPRRFPAGVRIRLQSGEELAATVLDSRSSPERPIRTPEVQAKFRAVTASSLSADQGNRIIEAVGSIDRQPVALLAELLRSAKHSAVTGSAQDVESAA